MNRISQLQHCAVANVHQFVKKHLLSQPQSMEMTTMTEVWYDQNRYILETSTLTGTPTSLDSPPRLQLPSGFTRIHITIWFHVITNGMCHSVKYEKLGNNKGVFWKSER